MESAVQSYVTSHCADEGYAGRIEVMTGPVGRRRWPEHVKAQIVLESYRDGVSVADVARRHGLSGPQLHAWRRAAREGLLPMPDDAALGLVPVMVAAGSGGGGDEPPDDSAGIQDAIVLEIAGVRMMVRPGFDPEHLARVIAALRGAA
jgi:transposase